MRAFVIHLKDAIQRIPFIDEMARLLPIEVVWATRQHDESLVAQGLAMKEHGRKLVPAEVGNALSHLSIYTRMLDEDIPAALILEDDSKISMAMPRFLQNIHKLPSDWEHINFCTDAAQEEFGEPIFDLYRATRMRPPANRANAYLLNQSGAKKLLKAALPIYLASDGLTGRTNMTGLVSYGVLPRLVSLHETPSVIGAR